MEVLEVCNLGGGCGLLNLMLERGYMEEPTYPGLYEAPWEITDMLIRLLLNL